MIRIYNFPRGARGLRAGWVCEEMGLTYEVVPVTFPPDAAYRALNSLGTVPFLEDDGVAISESVAIMLYLAQAYGPTPLLPKATTHFAKVLQWTLFGEASLGASLKSTARRAFWRSRSSKGELVGDDAAIARRAVSPAPCRSAWRSRIPGRQ
jgi:glutathione S-transferase